MTVGSPFPPAAKALDTAKLAAARLWASNRMPYLASALFACGVHTDPESGTIGVDVSWQVHADPANTPAEVLSMAAFTAPFNVSGQPAINLPLHWSDDGMPVGTQLVAGPWQDSLLLRVAAQLEQALPWAGRRPALDAPATGPN